VCRRRHGKIRQPDASDGVAELIAQKLRLTSGRRLRRELYAGLLRWGHAVFHPGPEVTQGGVDRRIVRKRIGRSGDGLDERHRDHLAEVPLPFGFHPLPEPTIEMRGAGDLPQAMGACVRLAYRQIPQHLGLGVEYQDASDASRRGGC
jgi:hypothetical protein